MMYIVLILILIVVLFMVYHKTHKSFVQFNLKETLEKTDIPIVTFDNAGIPLNFIVDSGATESHISEACSKLINGEEKEVPNYIITTGNGIIGNAKAVDIYLTKDKYNVTHRFMITPTLDGSFAFIEETKKVTVHGIIGTDFLIKHKGIVDLKKCRVIIHK